MKLKAFAVIAALTAALLLPACGQKNAPEEPAAPTETQTQAAPETAPTAPRTVPRRRLFSSESTPRPAHTRSVT